MLESSKLFSRDIVLYVIINFHAVILFTYLQMDGMKSVWSSYMSDEEFSKLTDDEVSTIITTM